jgi:protein gp37
VFQVMEDCPHLTFQVLTKRSERLAELAGLLPWPNNVWMGVSIENRDVLHHVNDLRRVPAAVRFLSCEPLIGPLGRFSLRGIDWVIVGRESGTSPRPMEPEWPLEIHDRCQLANVPFFFKQWGGRNKKAADRELRGEYHDALPCPKCRRKLTAV